VWSPFHPDAREAFYNPISQLEHWAMMIRDSLDEPFPYKLAYEYGGLLPIGRVNPYDLFFRTEGLPEKWTIVILESYYHHQEFEMSFTDFLVAAFSGGENSCLRELIEPFPERFHWVPARFTAR
jgi:hypothetical protein